METIVEIWKDIIGYEGLYQVSDLGRVRSCRMRITNRCGEINTRKLAVRRSFMHHKGYYKVGLTRCAIEKKHFVHRLVAAAFIPNPNNKPEVNHINGVKTDNRPCNLEWVTSSENNIHKVRVLGHARPLESYRKKKAG